MSSATGDTEVPRDCTHCGQHLPADAFSWKRKGVKRSSRCRKCQKIFKDQHYQDNKGVYISKAKEYTKSVVNIWYQQQKSKPCADCGGVFHRCQMDFDHLGDKDFSIAKSRYRFGKKRIESEMAKCELVCANCHRMRTFLRKQQADGPCGREPTFNLVKNGSTPLSASGNR